MKEYICACVCVCVCVDVEGNLIFLLLVAAKYWLPKQKLYTVCLLHHETRPLKIQASFSNFALVLPHSLLF
jgi:hypothetical protein